MYQFSREKHSIYINNQNNWFQRLMSDHRCTQRRNVPSRIRESRIFHSRFREWTFPRRLCALGYWNFPAKHNGFRQPKRTRSASVSARRLYAESSRLICNRRYGARLPVGGRVPRNTAATSLNGSAEIIHVSLYDSTFVHRPERKIVSIQRQRIIPCIM
jgi:hypothetical protein